MSREEYTGLSTKTEYVEKFDEEYRYDGWVLVCSTVLQLARTGLWVSTDYDVPQKVFNNNKRCARQFHRTCRKKHMGYVRRAIKEES